MRLFQLFVSVTAAVGTIDSLVRFEFCDSPEAISLIACIEAHALAAEIREAQSVFDRLVLVANRDSADELLEAHERDVSALIGEAVKGSAEAIDQLEELSAASSGSALASAFQGWIITMRRQILSLELEAANVFLQRAGKDLEALFHRHQSQIPESSENFDMHAHVAAGLVDLKPLAELYDVALARVDMLEELLGWRHL